MRSRRGYPPAAPGCSDKVPAAGKPSPAQGPDHAATCGGARASRPRPSWPAPEGAAAPASHWLGAVQLWAARVSIGWRARARRRRRHAGRTGQRQAAGGRREAGGPPRVSPARPRARGSGVQSDRRGALVSRDGGHRIRELVAHPGMAHLAGRSAGEKVRNRTVTGAGGWRGTKEAAKAARLNGRRGCSQTGPLLPSFGLRTKLSPPAGEELFRQRSPPATLLIVHARYEGAEANRLWSPKARLARYATLTRLFCRFVFGDAQSRICQNIP